MNFGHFESRRLPLENGPQLHGVKGVVESIADETHDGRGRGA